MTALGIARDSVRDHSTSGHEGRHGLLDAGCRLIEEVEAPVLSPEAVVENLLPTRHIGASEVDLLPGRDVVQDLIGVCQDRVAHREDGLGSRMMP